MDYRFVAKFAVLSALFVGAVFPQAAVAQAQWSVGYWADTNNESVSSIYWPGVTHVIHWTIEPNTGGTITFQCAQVACSQGSFSSYASNLIAAAHARGVKVLLGLDVGGNWSDATSSANVSTFVSNVMSVVDTYGYDGVDNDWEIGVNQGQYASYLSAMRSALGGRLLTATGAGENSASFWSSVAQYLDRFGLQTYDDETYASFAWFNSALYSDSETSCTNLNDYQASVDWYRGCFVAAGFPLSKLEIGLGFYGYVMNGATAPRQSLSGVTATQENYNTLLSKYNLANATFDSVGKVPWLPINGGYVTFDNAQSIGDKVTYAKSQNLGGWIIWNLATDYISSGTTPATQHPLAAAVATAMGATSYTAPSITSTSPLSAATLSTPYSLPINATGTAPMTWKVTNGALPAGLSLNSSSGMIAGTPTTVASYSFTIDVSNAAGSSSRQLSITVNSKSAASWYNLKSVNSGQCLDVTGMSTSPGAKLEQWPCSGVNNENFQFTPVQGGYKITAQNSGLQLDVEGGSSANGTPIIQYPYWGGKNEIWNLVPNVHGSYSITVLSSGKCMSVEGNYTTNGSPVQQSQCTGAANQEWSLAPIQ